MSGNAGLVQGNSIRKDVNIDTLKGRRRKQNEKAIVVSIFGAVHDADDGSDFRICGRRRSCRIELCLKRRTCNNRGRCYRFQDCGADRRERL